MMTSRCDFVKYTLGGILAANTAGALAGGGSAQKCASEEKENSFSRAATTNLKSEEITNE